MSWTPLHSSIVMSTVWREPNHVRIVWITLLALADRYGFVEGSVPGLADTARVSLDECVDSLERLTAPDEWSRTQDHDGRRIEKLEGGWQILNFSKFRVEQREANRREYKREWMRRYRARQRQQAECGQQEHDETPENKEIAE